MDNAFDSVNIIGTDYDSIYRDEFCDKTLTIEGKGKSIAFLTEMVVDPIYQDAKISNLMFSLVLRYLKRLNVNYVINKPYPTDIKKERYQGKKRDIQHAIYKLIDYYHHYSFQVTLRDESIKEKGNPYMVCYLDDLDIESARFKINSIYSDYESDVYYKTSVLKHKPLFLD